MIEVCLPGTGGMIPLKDRWLSCCHLSSFGTDILVDCGEGTQIALQQCGIRLSRLDVLLLTHFHADHVLGLPGLLLSLGNFGKTTPLSIVGPKGLLYVVSALCIIAPKLPYPVHLFEWEESDQKELTLGDLRIHALPLSHSIPCYAYRLTLFRKPVFNPIKADRLGIPKHLYSSLHAGKNIEFEGRTITPSMVIDAERAPMRVVYATDTLPIDSLVSFAQDTDLFICDGMHAQDDMQKKAHERGHMVFSDGARLAKQAGAKHLLLTHFSPSLLNPEDHVQIARDIFAETAVAFDGIRITL